VPFGAANRALHDSRPWAPPSAFLCGAPCVRDRCGKMFLSRPAGVVLFFYGSDEAPERRPSPPQFGGQGGMSSKSPPRWSTENTQLRPRARRGGYQHPQREEIAAPGESDDKARVDQVRVLAGGQGTFLVRYSQGSSELFGSGALRPTANGPAQTMTAQSTFATARDWLQVSGTGAGAGQIGLAVGGVPLSSVPFTIVDATTTRASRLPKRATRTSATPTSTRRARRIR
jgi:hypothetical protein